MGEKRKRNPKRSRGQKGRGERRSGEAAEQRERRAFFDRKLVVQEIPLERRTQENGEHEPPLKIIRKEQLNDDNSRKEHGAADARHATAVGAADAANGSAEDRERAVTTRTRTRSRSESASRSPAWR